MLTPTFSTTAEIQPLLEKLERHPGSLVLVAIEQPEERCNFCRVTWAWLSKQERRTLMTALERARKKRAALRQEARGDLAASKSSKDSVESL